MPKKSKEAVLQGKVEAGFGKHGLRLTGKVFSLDDKEGYCADYVIGDVLIEVITSAEDKKLEKLTKFKKRFGHRYTVFVFTSDDAKDVLSMKCYDALYTASSMNLMITKVIELINKK